MITNVPVATTTPDYRAIATQDAQKYGDNVPEFVNTMECESAGWQNGQSQVPDPTGPNGFEDSWGIPQIHLHDKQGHEVHPDITRAMALDATWALDWAARNFKTDPNMWSCYTKKYGARSP